MLPGRGISHALYAALWVLCLADAPDGLPMGALADGLLTRAADTTRLVDRLVKRRLATRKDVEGRSARRCSSRHPGGPRRSSSGSPPTSRRSTAASGPPSPTTRSVK